MEVKRGEKGQVRVQYGPEKRGAIPAIKRSSQQDNSQSSPVSPSEAQGSRHLEGAVSGLGRRSELVVARGAEKQPVHSRKLSLPQQTQHPGYQGGVAEIVGLFSPMSTE